MHPRVAIVVALVLASAACGGSITRTDSTAPASGGSAGSGGSVAAGAGGSGKGGSAAGTSGTAGSSLGIGGGVRLGEYDLVLSETVPNGPYSGPTVAPPVHLGLFGGAPGMARVNLPFGTLATVPFVLDPTQMFTPPPMSASGTFNPQGPLFIGASVSDGKSQISALALKMDVSGLPVQATANGFVPNAQVKCTQIFAGGSYIFGFAVVPDHTPPAAKGLVDALPWVDGVLLSEPVAQPAVTVDGATLMSLDLVGVRLMPTYTESGFTLLGKSVTFSFPALTDLSGNVTAATATLAYVDPGPAAPMHVFAKTGNCSGVLVPGISSDAGGRLVIRLTKAGASIAKLTLCRVGDSNYPTHVTAKATSGGGMTTTAVTKISTTMGTQMLAVDLPDQDVVLVVEGDGCGEVRLDAVTAM